MRGEEPATVDLKDEEREEEEPEALHVYDLPQLYTHPPFSALHTTLLALAITPSTFSFCHLPSVSEPTPTPTPRPAYPIAPEGVPRYLTGIISSPLSWLSEPERSRIHDLASLRLAERAGRTAAPDLDRVFHIPIGDQCDVDQAEEGRGNGRRTPAASSARTVAIRLHEPSLTGDNLGLKTWGAGALLAEMLYRLSGFLCSSLDATRAASVSREQEGEKPKPIRVLELGAGTGILGLAAAAVFNHVLNKSRWNENGAASDIEVLIHMTDLPAIVHNLAKNVQVNAEAVGARYVGAETDIKDERLASTSPTQTPQTRDADLKPNIFLSTRILDWSLSPPFARQKSTPTQGSSLPPTNTETHTGTSTRQNDVSKIPCSSGTYDIILVSDPLYSPFHPIQLTNTIVANLSPSLHKQRQRQHNPRPAPAKVISALPLRYGYAYERVTWRRLMYEAEFVKVAGGRLQGRSGDGEAEEEAEEEEEEENEWKGGGEGGEHEGEDKDEEEVGRGRKARFVVEWAVWSWKDATLC